MEFLSIIVPYRNRRSHLDEFIPFMEGSDFLKELNFEILVVEQEEGKPFNRGKLLNVGADYSSDSDYYCFHDVDMIPIISDYSFVPNPTHLAAEAEQFGYRLPYNGYFGGVTLFDRGSFLKSNGYSNEYWGWGAEDDDILFRCISRGIRTSRKSGKYRSLSHEREIIKDLYDRNLNKFFGFKNSRNPEEISQKIDSDGISTLEYEILSEKKIGDKSKMITVRI